MFFNHLRIAFRHLVKNPSFSFINLFGLTLGFFCFLLIALYLHDELSFDMFHKDANRTYRLLQHETLKDGTVRHVASVAARIHQEAVKQLPEVENAATVTAFGRLTLGNDPFNRSYEQMISTNAGFFQVFDFPFVEGDSRTALHDVDAIVLTETAAHKYLGEGPYLGRRIWAGGLRRNQQPIEFTVAGVVKDYPRNSHIQIDVIFSEATWPTVFSWYNDEIANDWTSNNYATYLKLRPGTDPRGVEKKITEITRNNYPATRMFSSTFSLQPLQDVHLYSENLQDGDTNTSGIKPFHLYLFASIAFLVLLIACLNYMNLSTAATYKRTREIGTRKTLGAQKSQLIAQFSGEAILLSVASLIIAVAALQTSLPLINSFTDKEMALSALPDTWILALAGTVLLAGILSSLYPSYIITRILPSEALRKDIKFGNRSLPVRKILVAAQFAISIMMIASTLVIYRQLNFMRSKELGIDVANQLVIDINSQPLRRNFEGVKAEFAKVSEVQKISTSTRVPGEWKTFPIATVRSENETTGREMIFVGIDEDFLSTYNIPLIQGRNFVSGSSDSLKVILTKMAVVELGLTDPVGKMITIPIVRNGGNIRNLDRPFMAEVIGVAEDFHFESFRQKMSPVIFASPNTQIQRIDYYTLTIKTTDWPATIEKLKQVNTKIDPENPLEYTFLSNRFEEFYRADEKRGQIFLAFSFVIVMIACLGLFALVSYSIESRVKEIGIRKVLGASVQNLIAMVSKEFLLIVLFSGVVALPAAWYLMNKWLTDFAYRIDIGAGILVLSPVIALTIAFATISFRAFKAAMANPVESLKND